MSDNSVIGNLKVRVGMDTAEFAGKMSTFKNQLKVLKNNMVEVTNSTRDWDKSGAGLQSQISNITARLKLYNAELDKQERNLKQARENIKTYVDGYEEQKRVIKSANHEKAEEARLLNQLKQDRDSATKAEQNAMLTISKLRSEMSGLNKELEETQLRYAVQTDKWANRFQDLSNKGSRIRSFGEDVANAGRAWTAANAVVGAGVLGVVKMASDYESAFAGVRKTVDATEPELRQLSDGFRNLSKELPVSAVEIAKIGENAGQLGIQVPNILGFTEIMSKMGMATNLSSDEASSSLAKFANITKMSQSDFSRLGSSIVELGNNFATTEQDIVAMSMQLAGAGSSVGLSEAQILGISTALSSLGIEAERGGSTFSKLMVNMKVASETGFKKAKRISEMTGLTMRDLSMMASNNSKEFKELANSLGMTTTELSKVAEANDDLMRFARVAGMSGEAFQKLFKEDAVGAISAFVDGLSKAEERGKSAVEVLDEMGISEIRLRDTLLRVGGAQGLFNKAVQTGTEAWKENNALNKEVEKRNETLAAKFEMFKNKLIDVAINLGSELMPALTDFLEHSDWLLDGVKGVADWFGGLDDGTKKLIVTMVGLNAAIAPLTWGLGNLLKLFGGGMQSVFGFAGKMREIKIATDVAKASADTLGTAIGGTGLAAKASALLFNPYTLAVAGTVAVVGGLTWGMLELTKGSRESAESIKRWGVDLDKGTSDALKNVEDFSRNAKDKLSTAFQLDGTEFENISKEFSQSFEESKRVIEENIQKIEESYSKLPEVAKKYASDEHKERIDGMHKSKAKIDEIEKEINSILQRAIDERRALRQDENNHIAKLAEEAKRLTVESLGKSAEEQRRIMQNMSDTNKNMSIKELEDRMKNIRTQTEGLKKAYEEQAQAVKDARMRGDLDERQYNESMLALDKEYAEKRKNLAISMYEAGEERIRKLREKGQNSYANKQTAILKSQLERMGHAYDEMAAIVSAKNEKLAEGSKYLVNHASELSSTFSEAVNKANAAWNNLITDDSTGMIVDNMNEVIAKSLETQDGWNNLKFIVQNAHLSTNAKEKIIEVLESKGQWDNLTMEEKAMLMSTNAGEIMHEFMSANGQWDSLSPQQKAMIMTTNAPEEQWKFMTAHNVWTNSEFQKKWAEIDGNAPDAQRKFMELIATWYANHLHTKTGYVNADTSQAHAALNAIIAKHNSMNGMQTWSTHFINTVRNDPKSYSLMQMGYATGTNFHKGGLAFLGDGGRSEPFLTPDGYLGVSPNKDTLYDLPRGTKVWSSVNKFINSVKYDKNLSHLIDKLPRFATGTTQSFLDRTPMNFLNNSAPKNSVSFIGGGTSGSNININIDFNMNDVSIRRQEDLFELAEKVGEVLYNEINRKLSLKGGAYV